MQGRESQGNVVLQSSGSAPCRLNGKLIDRGALLALLPMSGKSTVHLLAMIMLLLGWCGWPNSMLVGTLARFCSVVGDALRTIDVMSIPAGRSSGIAERALMV